MKLILSILFISCITAQAQVFPNPILKAVPLKGITAQAYNIISAQYFDSLMTSHLALSYKMDSLFNVIMLNSLRLYSLEKKIDQVDKTANKGYEIKEAAIDTITNILRLTLKAVQQP